MMRDRLNENINTMATAQLNPHSFRNEWRNCHGSDRIAAVFGGILALIGAITIYICCIFS